MSIIAEFTVPTESFALERALRGDSGTTVELERVVPTNQAVAPYVVAWDCNDYEEFERAARDDPAVERLTRMDRIENGALYHVEWTREVTDLVEGITRTGATLLEGQGTHRRWRFELRFPGPKSVDAFRDQLQVKKSELALDRLHTVSKLQTVDDYGLTGEQTKTLVTAYEEGYFDEPRHISQRDLADRLDVSSGAVTGRLRRGLSTLVSNTLLRRE